MGDFHKQSFKFHKEEEEVLIKAKINSNKSFFLFRRVSERIVFRFPLQPLNCLAWVFRVRLPLCCLPGRASDPISQPHQRSLCQEPRQRAPDAPLRPGTIKTHFDFAQNHLPLSVQSELLLTKVSPPPELQWDLPVQFDSRKQDLLQTQEGWVDASVKGEILTQPCHEKKKKNQSLRGVQSCLFLWIH